MLHWKEPQRMRCSIFHFAQEKQTQGGEVTWISSLLSDPGSDSGSARRKFYSDGKDWEPLEGE